MHIVFLTNEYPKKGKSHGGIGTFVKFLAEKLIAKDFNISVVGINNDHTNEFSNEGGIHIHRLKKSSWKFAKFYQHKNRILKKLKVIHNEIPIDIVEGSELNFAFFPVSTPYKKLVRLHGGHHFFAIELNKETAFWRGYQEKQSFKKADNFIAVSNYVGKQTQKYLKSNFDYKVLYNSIDTEKFKLADITNLQENSLLFVGTLCEKKGILQLIQAIPIIKKYIPSVHLKIIGRDFVDKKGNSFSEYLQSFISKDLKNNIEILGPVPHDEVYNYIECANICVYPSHMEAMPIAWMEVLSMGKTLVASDIGPGRELVIDGVTGILINPLDIKQIAYAIISLLNKNEVNSYGEAARNDIVSRFNPEKIVEQNIEFYKTII